MERQKLIQDFNNPIYVSINERGKRIFKQLSISYNANEMCSICPEWQEIMTDGTKLIMEDIYLHIYKNSPNKLTCDYKCMVCQMLFPSEHSRNLCPCFKSSYKKEDIIFICNSFATLGQFITYRDDYNVNFYRNRQNVNNLLPDRDREKEIRRKAAWKRGK